MECPACHGYVIVDECTGTLFPHLRHVDGGGPGPGQSHDQVQCEGSGARAIVKD